MLRYKITMAKGNAKLRAASLFAYLHVETNTVYDKYYAKIRTNENVESTRAHPS